MKVMSVNVNGLRSAERKGFFAWLIKQNADVICLQEIKAQEEHTQDKKFILQGYQAHFHHAEKKGYSGVGIYSKFAPQKIIRGLGWDTVDAEGRYIEADFGTFCIASLYMPSGTSGDARQKIKYDFLARYAKHLNLLASSGKEYIICGDWNIAHKAIDLKNWRANQKNSGFLPDERLWMDKLFGEMGFIDAFRIINQEPEQYTWWSNRGRAREKNVGWRIDYQVITNGLKNKIKSASIYKEQFFSDHAPLTIEYDIILNR